MAKIVFLGGGERERILKAKLSLQYDVESINSPDELEAATWSIKEGSVFIAPLSSTDDLGTIRESNGLSLLETLDYIPQGSLLLIGAARNMLREKAVKKEVIVCELGQLDELAWLNAIPTAEGTIKTLMTELNTTIFGAKFLIIGAGRIALTLGIRLKFLGGEVVIAARANAELARATALFLGTTSLKEVKGNWVAVINTVPAPILDQDFFANNATPIYVELASSSGIKDALDAKIRHLPLPGLPGKYAPQASGAYLAQTVPPLIERYFRGDWPEQRREKL